MILTVGVNGESMVPWRRPSQLKPSNHLKDKRTCCHDYSLIRAQKASFMVSLVFLDVLHSVHLVPQSL